MKDISIDTCSLNKVLDDPLKTRAIIKIFTEIPLRLMINERVLAEMLNNPELKEIEYRALLLKRLFKAIPKKKIALSPNFPHIIECEIRRLVSRTPVSDRSDQRKLLENITNPEMLKLLTERLEQNCGITKRKIEYFKHDKNVQRDVKERGIILSGKDIHTIFDPNDKQLQIISQVAKEDWSVAFSPNDYINNSDRYPTITAFAALGNLTQSGCFKINGIDPMLETSLKPKKNNWYDSFIATASQYSEYFITDDNGCREKCNYLYERKVLKFRSITLDYFLGESPNLNNPC